MTTKPRPSSLLKKFAKALPSEQDVYNVLDLLKRENSPFADYAIAMIGASYLERSIAISMIGRFVDLNPEEERRLFSFDADGPLATFSARIKVGYAMYLFGRETRDDLESIAKIRNLFAHHPSLITFNLPETKANCESLLVLKRLPAGEKKHTDNDPKGSYIAACQRIAHGMRMGVERRGMKWDLSRDRPFKPPRDVP
jgi:hypothetical protein